jgi:hypothetical protein
VRALKRVLYAEAALWAAIGLVLAVIPRPVVVGLFGSRAGGALVWHRFLGANVFGLALVMVLVAHRIQEVWWWSWAFAFSSVASAIAALLHSAFGLGSAESRGAWWTASSVLVAFAFGLLYGIFVASREQPLPPELRAPPA